MSGYTSLGKRGGSGAGGGGGDLNANSTGPFGTLLVSDLTPTGQAAFYSGINSTQWITGAVGLSATGTPASVSATDGVVFCTSGNSLSGSAFINMGRGVKYRAGQGVLGRFTAIFGPGQPDTLQLAGIGNVESGFWFCLSGSNSFGILHRESSTREVRKFASFSALGAVTLTVTLDGKTKSITINGGTNANQTAHLVAAQDYSQVGSGWTAEAHEDDVYFIANVPGPFGGTFSIVNGGSPVATPSVVNVGALPTQTFISQSQWNIDTMDGKGSSRFTLDRTKGNIYGVGYQYLGFGNPSFSIEDPETGLLKKCHMIQRANASTATVVKNPNMSVGWMAINSGSAASSVTVKGASAASFVEGQILRNIGIGFSSTAIKGPISSTEVPVLTIRVDKIHNNMCSHGETAPTHMSLANDSGTSSSGKLLKFFVYKNATLGGPVTWRDVDSRSIVAYDTSATSFSTNSNTLLMKSIIVAANGSVEVNLAEEGIYLTAGESLTITAQRVSNDIDNAAVSISWYEDQ